MRYFFRDCKFMLFWIVLFNIDRLLFIILVVFGGCLFVVYLCNYKINVYIWKNICNFD